jgi:tRNA dimethylallyltransferase
VAALTADAPAPLLILLGPTASGKTALSLDLAQRFGGEIVSCDSVALYRDFEIGTAKPTPQERALVPHHLIDFASPATPCTAGDYSRAARRALREIAERGRLPIVTGGTGLYLRALTDGLFAGPERSEELRRRLRRSAAARGSGWLHRMLRRLDPVAAARIHAHDTPKLIRALEVSLAARRPMSELWKRGSEPLLGYRILRLGLLPARADLYARIDARAAAMFAHGLTEETARLQAQYGPDLKLFDALGYRQAAAFLRGELSREQAIRLAQQGHRNYAKRQLTWFRREPEVHWIAGFGDDPAVAAEAAALVARLLGLQPR